MAQLACVTSAVYESFTAVRIARDPQPYAKCAKQLVRSYIKDGGDSYATLDGEDLTIRRVGSKPFEWTFHEESTVFPSVPVNSYDAATYGFWVYVPEGLPEGEHTVRFGGFFGIDVTYTLITV